jgi:DNA gyrase/topoisomerase IV subunit A
MDNPDERIVCLSDDYKIRQIKPNEFANRQIQVGGRVVSSGLTRGAKDMILLLSEKGQYLYFDKSDVPEFSRTAGGVKTSFESSHGAVKVIIMNSQSPSALFAFGMKDVSGDQGYVFFVSPSKLLVGKRVNQPKSISPDAAHIRFESGTIVIPKKDQKTEFIMVGPVDMTSISSKFVNETGIPRRTTVVPLGSILYD